MKTHAFPRIFTTVLLLLLLLTLASCTAAVENPLPTDPATEGEGTGTDICTSEAPSKETPTEEGTAAPEKPTEAPTEPTESPTESSETPAESSETPAESSEVPEESSETPEESSETPEESSEVPEEDSGEDPPAVDPLSPTEGLAYLRYHDGYGYADEYVLVGMGSSTAEHLVIPSTHKGWPVREIEAGAFRENTKLLSVTFLDGTKQIPEGLFTDCTALTRVCIMEGTKSIGNSAFAGCTALSEVTLPESLGSIGTQAFSGCAALEKVTISATSVEIGTQAFSGCAALPEISFLAKLSSVPARAFEGCTSLEAVVLPEDLRSIGAGAFAGCTALSEITIPEAVILDTLDGVFKNCTGLRSVTFTGERARIPSRFFEGCTSLTDVTLPEGLTEISAGVFSGCSSLSEILLPGSLRRIGARAFEKCTALAAIELPEELTALGEEAFNGCVTLTELSIPASVKSVGQKAFMNCTSLSSVTLHRLPEVVGENAFYGCEPKVTVIYEEVPAEDELVRLSRVLPPDVRVQAADGSYSYASPFLAYRWNDDLNCMRNYFGNAPALPVLKYAPHDHSVSESGIEPATLGINGAEFSIPYSTTFWGESYASVPLRVYSDRERGLSLALFREDGSIRDFNAYGYYATAGDPAYRPVTEDADALAIATEFIEAQVLRQISDVTLSDYRMSVTHHTRTTAGEEYVGYDYVSFRFVWCMDGAPTKDEIRISVSAGGNIVYFYRGSDCSFAAGDTVGIAEAYEYAWMQARYEAGRFYEGTVGYVNLVSIDRVQNRLAYRFRVGLPHGAPNAEAYSECQSHYYIEMILLRNPDVEGFLSGTDPNGTLAFGGVAGDEAVYAVPAEERETLTDASASTVTEENIPDREFVLNGRTLNAIYVETRTGDPAGRAERVRIHRDAETGITLGFDAESGRLVLLDARDYYDGAGDVSPEGVGTWGEILSQFLAAHAEDFVPDFPTYRPLQFFYSAKESAHSYGYARYVYTRYAGTVKTPDRLVLHLSDGKNVVYFERGADYADVEAPDVDVAEADRAVVQWASRYVSYLDCGVLRGITFSGVAENALGVGLLYRVDYECRSADGESTVSFTETYFYLPTPADTEPPV